ncbi:SIS domain-containing protein [Mesorhizobium sp. M2D.F.Ca.ET.185.01.1.1]|uniref:SIS domain-containing protein n=1 Tax=unclassified Mesorhizobium TaxID=325217 RepID=UPI000FCC161A|nr:MULTISPECIES: SIS domain-containing protein [unclassified Mesorhizobium]TGP82894.1 SIS domain-containing protein [bacterium M00.F.Ca.ET.227.01.1.1]TGP94635.1 SIS domain-containing protein [bacterium M00.F.Ca.ET.221.01.1.1]TGP98089.1 SIS domain-containing protein [bacterium M00.F.Ca.ET.222.01.1.1]TGT75398.1 SIS domain-containing protein [bacterium M00.F.Ca.ET.159.01.1.1]TGT88266.1 SIS domain-containing protein [bacterium M00.F.Ca.ET.157.01.1.1]TGU11920.1 SIS domain-containing protein [bacte
MTEEKKRPAGLIAIDREMSRQHEDALASFASNQEVAARVAASIRRNGRLVLLGMGASHAVARAVEPLYRAHGIDAIALPLSEQLGQKLPLAGKTVIVTSQSGESAEVLRWFAETGDRTGTFGLTLEAGSFLGRTVPCLVGAGGTELAFAATRSLTVTFALHLAILAALGDDPAAALAALKTPETVEIDPALAALGNVATVVTSGRSLQGVAEALALGLTELSRLPCFSLEGGQLRHGPMEMLGPKIGVVLFRGKDATADLVTAMALSVVEAGAPLIVFDASGMPPVAGAVTLRFKPASGLAAVFAMLPVAQRLMIAFADSRVENAGTPVRTTKITRSE